MIPASLLLSHRLVYLVKGTWSSVILTKRHDRHSRNIDRLFSVNKVEKDGQNRDNSWSSEQLRFKKK